MTWPWNPQYRAEGAWEVSWQGVSTFGLFTICFSTRTMMIGPWPGLGTCNFGQGLLRTSKSPRILTVEILLPLDKLCYRCETAQAAAGETCRCFEGASAGREDAGRRECDIPLDGSSRCCMTW